MSIVLINQACIDKCNSEIPECSECKKDHQIPASILNFTFSEEIIPCANYQYLIKLFGSSSDSINQTISTNDLRYLISKTPNIISITDKTITLKVILNDPESLCQNNMYYVKCEVNEKEVFSKESHEQTIVIENLEPRLNYSCSTRIKHGNTTWSEYSESLIITTNATGKSFSIRKKFNQNLLICKLILYYKIYFDLHCIIKRFNRKLFDKR